MTLTDEPTAAWPLVWPGGVQPVDTYATVAILAASGLLWAASGRRFGAHQVTGLRPCREPLTGIYGSWPGSYPAYSTLWPLVRDNPGVVGCGMHGGSDCACSWITQAVFTFSVATIDQVRVDGVILDPAAYRLDDWRKLVRRDGGSWPWCQNLNLDDTAVGTWAVDLTTGIGIPALGKLAVGELARELYLDLTGSDCALPTKVTSIVRQNVTIQTIDANAYLTAGRIGLPICDLFLWTYNPNNLREPPAVYSRDWPRPRHAGT